MPDARAAVRESAASDPAAAETATPMPWDRHLRAAALASVAMAVPDRVVPNATVAEGAGVTERWIVHRTGVHERRHVSEGERLQDLATAAGRQALDEAGVDAEDVDLVLVATLAADELTPNCAPLVAHDLGTRRAGAMDVSAACTGFLSALTLATAQVEGGRADKVLVIGADVLSRFVDRKDRGTAAIFADGAGAALVAPSEAAREATQRAGLDLDDIGLFVYHQANARILAAVGERLGLDSERVINSIERYGNTSAATLPIALVDARERGMLEPGMNVLLPAFGAGFTWGAGVIEWAA